MKKNILLFLCMSIFSVCFCFAQNRVDADSFEGENTDEFTMEDLDTLVNNHTKVLVDFGANWCMPCIQMKPRIRKIEKLYQDKIYIKRINVDHAETLTKSLHITSIPVLLLFENGKLMRTLPGLQTMKILKEFVQ